MINEVTVQALQFILWGFPCTRMRFTAFDLNHLRRFRFDEGFLDNTLVRPTLMGAKNFHENGPDPFFLLWEREWSRFV